MEDKTFIVRGNWLDAIKNLTIEQQDAVIGDLVRYGVELPLRHEKDPIVGAMVNLVKKQIDFSKDKYTQKVNSSKMAGAKKKFTDKQIYDLAQGYSKAEEIAAVLGCSVSTINHSEGWKHRKDPDWS